MKILPCRLINNPLFRCPRTMAPYMPLNIIKNQQLKRMPYVPPEVKFVSVRPDKVLSISYYDKSIALRDIKTLCSEAVDYKKKLDAVLNKYLSKYIADDNNPDRPIREIKGRIKSPDSVMEKVQGLIQNCPDIAQKLETKAGIKEEIKDLVGKKVVLRSDDKKETAKIIEAIFTAHKNGELNISEVEIYYPSISEKGEEFIQFMQSQYGKKISRKECEKIISNKEYFSYVNSSELNRLAEQYGIELKYPVLNTGYTAIHIGTLSPDGFKGEIQIIGCNVEKLSNVEHQYYKAKCGKKVDPVLEERFKPITPQSKDYVTKALIQDYTFKAYIFERLKAKVPHKQRIDSEFLRAPQRLLDMQLGFNQNAPIIRGHWQRSKEGPWKMYTMPQ